MTQPLFSIIVPTHGRNAALQGCLAALNTLDYPPDSYEIVVVYDGSGPENTAEQSHPNLHLLTQPKSGPAAARNLGASEANGRYLAFTDDDCLPEPGWLAQLAAALEQHPARLIGGQTTNALPDNPFATASQLLVDYLYHYYNPNPHAAQFFTSNNLALRRDLFLETGGFDSQFPLAAGEDRDFCRRWLHQGGSLYYQPAAIVHHAHHLTLKTFWKQHLNYGRGAYRYRNQSPNQKREPLSFYLNLLRYPLQQKNNHPAPVLFLLFCLMQCANTAGFLREAYFTR